jgi:hypothetical protein
MPDVLPDRSSDLPDFPHRVPRWALVRPVSCIVAVSMTAMMITMISTLIVVFLSPQRFPQTFVPPLCLFDFCAVEYALRQGAYEPSVGESMRMKDRMGRSRSR